MKRGGKIDMRDNNNFSLDYQKIIENYMDKAKIIHNLLIDKFQLPNKPFSKIELSNNAFKLKSKNVVSYDLINKILNVSKTMSNSKISSNDLKELEGLLNYLKRMSLKQSRLEMNMKKLSIQSKDSIINENDFDDYKEYMHIKRPIESKFEAKLFNHMIPKQKSILFLVGNVGDGKSHLLSYMTKKYQNEFKDYEINIHNDATETNSPIKTAIETLLQVFQPYSDLELSNGKQNRLIIAINLGVLTNLITIMKENEKFNQLVSYIEETNVTNNREKNLMEHEIFDVISFREDSNFEYTGTELTSEFYSEALNRVFSKSESNPFYLAYKEDVSEGVEGILHYNFEFMLREEIQNTIIFLLIKAEIEHRAIISARELFNFFYEICTPRDTKESYNSYLPYLLFDNTSKSNLLTIINSCDPARYQTRKIDEKAIQIYHATDTYSEVLKLLGTEKDNFKKIFESFKAYQDRFDDFFSTFLRLKYLLNHQDELFDNRVFNEYMEEYHKVENKENYREMIILISRSMEKWHGLSPKDNHIIRDTSNNNIKLILAIKLKPEKPFIQAGVMVFPFVFGDNLYNLEIDYQVFKVLKKIDYGYFLKGEDYQNAVQFDRFVNHYLYSQELLDENYLYNLTSNQMYKLSEKYGQIELDKE